MIEAETRETLTPPQLAARWGVHPDKVIHFINSGELKAINLAVNRKGKPRYRIRLTEVARFEEARSTQPPVPKVRRRRRRLEMAGKDYFA
jgi:hypothetical protein